MLHAFLVDGPDDFYYFMVETPVGTFLYINRLYVGDLNLENAVEKLGT